MWNADKNGNAESALRNAEAATQKMKSAPNRVECFSPLRNPQKAMRNSAFSRPQVTSEYCDML